MNVDGAKLCGGVWLPDTEEHLVDWMEKSKRSKEVGGKLTYQYHKLDEACRHVRKGIDVECIDIGAHVGLWAMHLVNRFSLVHCFEPVTKFAHILSHNVKEDNYILHNIALGNKSNTTVDIVFPKNMTGNSHVEDNQEGGKRYRDGDPKAGLDVHKDIPVAKLDEYEFKNVGFIKIDVEGYELPVLKGAKQTLLRHKPIVVVEQKGNETYYGEKRNSAARWLEKLGMRDIKVMSGDHIMGWR